MPMGHPARGVQEAIQREVRAGDGSDVLLQSAVDKHFRKCQELETSSGPFLKAQTSTLNFS